MKAVLPALPVPNFVLFPGCTVTLQFGFPALQEQLELARRNGGRIVVAHSLQGSKGWVPARFGCLAEVRQVQGTPHGLQATLAGVTRVELLSQLHNDGRLLWECQRLDSLKWTGKRLPELPGLPEMVKEHRSKLPAELWLDVVAFHLPNLPLEQKLLLLAEPDPSRRYYQLLESTRTSYKERKISLN